MAPIDIVISIIKRHKQDAETASEVTEISNEFWYYSGQACMCEKLIDELEGFKKLFN